MIGPLQVSLGNFHNGYVRKIKQMKRFKPIVNSKKNKICTLDKYILQCWGPAGNI